jgi:hypothetical protein
MESHSEQYFNDLAEKVYKSTSIESPSLDFTARVMSRLEEQTAAAYRPLISKKGWIGIALVIAAIISYSIFGGVESSGILENVDYSIITNNKLTDALSAIQFSKTVIYCVAIFGVAWLFYVPLMKQHMERRLEF